MSEKVLRATHRGELSIGELRIPCAVLEDGRRVLSENGITVALGSRSGGSKRRKKAQQESGAPTPLFLAPNNLKPFIDEVLGCGPLVPVVYREGRKITQGYEATILPAICDVWLRARQAGALQEQQLEKAQKAEILMRGLAHIGIIALVDEATGYQEVRDKQALREILEKFIAKELRPWVKVFPDEFYENLFRLRRWQYKPLSVKRPGVVGKITNDLIYKRLAPAVLDELQRVTPKDEKGRRKSRYHQWLTEDIGHPKLREHIASVITLMKASQSWQVFYRLLQRALPQYGATLELPFSDEEIDKLSG